MILPPLALDIARIKSEAKRRSQLKHAPSQLSISSFGSADTSTLATRLSPIVSQSTKFSGQNITKPNAKGSSLAGGRSFRDTLDLRSKPSQARFSLGTTESPEVQKEHNPTDGNVISSPDPITSRNTTTPKRKSKTMVSAAGSPERQLTTNNNSQTLNGAMRQPKRQSSQTSSRSSGGNPFQWDYASISPSGKPGSTNKSSGLGLGSSNTSSLPSPPRSSTFAPELKFNATSIRASLTSTSPELTLVGYDQSFVVSPTDHILLHLSEREQKRLSDGSIFSLSKFPTAPSVIEPVDIDMTRPLSFPHAQRYEFGGTWMLETPFLQQYPFGTQYSRRERSPSPTSIIDIDECDPENPSCTYQTPTNANPRAFQSAFATIPEESSVSSQKTADTGRLQYDSPPVSPKTLSPPSFTLGAHSAYNLPIHATIIPEEPADTIDPSMTSKDDFSMLNSSFDEGNVNAKKAKTGRGERRYLRLGREDSMQVPGDESWLDELEDECSVELDEVEGRRLVGSIIEDYDEGCTMLDINEDTSMTSISSAQPERSTNVGIVEEDQTTADASQRSSSIWEESEKFWTSNTPAPPSSPTKPKDRYKPLASSPLATPYTPLSKQGRKRDFEVAKDASSPKQEDEDSCTHSHTKKNRDSNGRRHSSRYRKRSALGVGTPNVRIQVTSPNGRVVGDGFGTPGSLYDADGFLR
ncbi:hypothetical protein TUN199_06963 [Pyrenophora tritici-repentis]|nr:hypothetical protein TUN199_06963 [Pyrenophora tritici-repentis]